MEAKLKQEQHQQYSCVYTGTLNREETLESVVPDVLPDITRILDTDCSLYLRGKAIYKEKAEVEANLQAVILYLADNSQNICRLELSKNLNFTLESECLEEKDQLCVWLQLNHADTRILNPRKVLLRADIQGEVNAYRSETVTIAVDREEPEELQVKISQFPVQSITCVGEKAFSVSEEFTVTSAYSGIDELLTARAHASIDETKHVGEKMILQGTVNLKVLYRPKDEYVPRSESFTTTFSQIIDCPSGADGTHTLQLSPTSLRLDAMNGGNGSPVILMDIHLVVQTVCRTRTDLSFIVDAYSTTGEESVQKKAIPLCVSSETVYLRETVREMMETPEVVTEILDAYMQPGVAVVGERGVRIPVQVKVLYVTDNGSLNSMIRRFQVDMVCDDMRDKKIILHQIECTDPYFAPTSGGIEIRLPVEMKLEHYEEATLSVVNAVELEMEDTKSSYEGPSLIVVRCNDSDLWNLAKRYKTTVDSIEAANKIKVEAGQLLLIPRAR